MHRNLPRRIETTPAAGLIVILSPTSHAVRSLSIQHLAGPSPSAPIEAKSHRSTSLVAENPFQTAIVLDHLYGSTPQAQTPPFLLHLSGLEFEHRA